MAEYIHVVSAVCFLRDSLEAVGGGVGSQDTLILAKLRLVQRVGILGSVLPQLRPHRMTPLTKPVVKQHTYQPTI